MSPEDFYTVSAVPFGYLANRQYVRLDGVDDVMVAAFTTDFRSWRETPLGDVVTPCPDWTPRWNSYAREVLHSDDRVIVLALEVDPAATVCDPQNPREFRHPVAWATSDGVHWDRTATDWPFGSEFTEGGSVMGSWWVDGAFEMVVQSRWVPITLVLRSADGITWREIARFNQEPPGDVRMFTALSGDGTRAIVMTTPDDTNNRTTLSLLVSHDGENWTEVQTAFTGARPNSPEGDDWLGPIFPPRSPIDQWTVLLEHDDCFETHRRATVWLSPDLAQWSSADLPWIVPRAQVYSTRYGLIARGGEYCDVTGSDGPATPEGGQLLLSRDGQTWEPLRPRRLRNFEINVVDGPAGVFLIDDTGEVWSTGQNG